MLFGGIKTEHWVSGGAEASNVYLEVHKEDLEVSTGYLEVQEASFGYLELQEASSVYPEVLEASRRCCRKALGMWRCRK